MSGDIEVDVLVAGAGAAGMTAALVCALQGLDVLLCEKSAQVFWGNGRVHDRDWPALVKLADSIDPSYRN